jgi:hypothetical protein
MANSAVFKLMEVLIHPHEFELHAAQSYHPEGEDPLPQGTFYDVRFEESVMSGRNEPPGILEMLPIDKHGLVVAASRPGHTCRAYIGALKGEDYYGEAPDVVANGSEIPFELALQCFEDLAKESWVVGNELQVLPPTEGEIELMREQGWKVSRGGQ